MEFKIECPCCNQHYSVDDSFVGQKVECSVCEKEFVVSKSKDTIQKGNKNTQNYFSDYFAMKEKTNTPNVSRKNNQERKDCCQPRRNNRKGIVTLSYIAPR